MAELGRFDEAVAAYRKALKLQPDHANAHNNLGNGLQALGRLEEAVAAFRAALERQPNHAEAHNNLGNALHELGQSTEAVHVLRAALKLRPDYAEAHYNLGNALNSLGEAEQAVAAYQAALRQKPNYAEAFYNLGNALRSLGKLEDAVAAFRKATSLRPDHFEALNNLGLVLADQGKLHEALAAYRTALARRPSHAQAHSNLLLCMNYDAQTSQQDILEESRRWNNARAPSHVLRRRLSDHNTKRRLRVGYVSPDFREHSVSHFLEPVLAEHDHRAFEVFCYAEVAKPDHKTARFRDLSDHWCSTVGMPDQKLADRIRADGIDILIDLAGHTARNRLSIFAERPAPVQVTWLGYPNTTGLSAMDYRLTDAIADPDGDADDLHCEELVRLPNGFLCFAPTADAPDIAEIPALSTDHVTFGSFNILAKVTPPVVETWAQILRRVPTSRLILKSRSLSDEATRERYREMFAANDVGVERLELLSWISSTTGHLGAYDRIDIGLDPFPYNGTTTTCEAMWMGVPCVTLRGNRHAGRVGATLLTRVNLADLVAETTTGYIDKAVTLANDLDQLAALRRGLRDRMRTSPLCDRQGFTHDIEAAYREMWRRACP